MEGNRTEQIHLVATAMAYIHTSARAALHRLHRHQRASHMYQFFTPLTFMELTHIYKLVAAYIAHEMKVLGCVLTFRGLWEGQGENEAIAYTPKLTAHHLLLLLLLLLYNLTR